MYLSLYNQPYQIYIERGVSGSRTGPISIKICTLYSESRRGGEVERGGKCGSPGGLKSYIGGGSQETRRPMSLRDTARPIETVDRELVSVNIN